MAAELVVSAVRPLVVRKYERAVGPVPAVVALVLEVPAGELGRGAEPGDVAVLYSESLGDAARSRRLLGGGRRARFRPLVDRRGWSGRQPSPRELGGHPLEPWPERSKAPLRGDQLIGVGGGRSRTPRGTRGGNTPPGQ